MHSLTVKLSDRSYPIHIGAGLLRDGNLVEQTIRASKLLLISNTTVAPLYSSLVRRMLDSRQVIEITVADGEQHKSLTSASRVFDVMVANRIARDGAVLALGGGVIGDLAGFVAAVYQRGIDFYQLPTTLLADVDSSVGGKTAVNHPGGKNLIGAFHQPKGVLIDTELLRTLPERELQAGLAEVIKYGLICDVDFLGWIEAHIDALCARDDEALAYAIHRSCEIKAEFVARDERETGDRALLNLGHTFGHAIEVATGYVEWLHGEAVGAGLLLAADMSAKLGLLKSTDVKRVARLLEAAGLRTDVPRIGAARALEYMGVDKKVKAGRIRLVLMNKLGSAFLTGDYDDRVLHQTLAEHFG